MASQITTLPDTHDRDVLDELAVVLAVAGYRMHLTGRELEAAVMRMHEDGVDHTLIAWRTGIDAPAEVQRIVNREQARRLRARKAGAACAS